MITKKEDFKSELKRFLTKHINNPILTLIIMKYIGSLVGKQNISAGDQIHNLRERLEK